MIRKHFFSLIALLAAALLAGGTLAVLRAQQPADKVPAAGTSPGSVAPAPQGSPRNATGAFPGGGGFGGAPSTPPRAWGAGPPGMMMPAGMAADDDPEMAELAQAEAAAAGESSEILARLAETENAADRKKISAELRDSLARQFDVQRQRRELELVRIEEQVRKLREQLKKRIDARETIIDRRLDQLVNEVDGLGWAPPAQGLQRSAPGSSSADMMRSMTPASRSKSAPAKR